MRPTAWRILTIAAFFVVFFPRHVFAYLDPGTGSMAFQAAAAAITATAYAVRVYWRRIVSIFRKDPKEVGVAPDASREGRASP